MKQNNLIFILAAIIIAGGSFFAGIKYQESKRPNFQIMGQNGSITAQNIQLNPQFRGSVSTPSAK